MADGARGDILYVDDEEGLVFVISRLLARRGYRVSGHTNAEAALGALKAAPGSFGLAVIDYNIPGSSGLAIAEQILAVEPDLPVVLASGYVPDDLHAEAQRIGVRRVICKPGSADALCNLVTDLLGS